MAEINVDIERARMLVARITPRSGADPALTTSLTQVTSAIKDLSQRLQSKRGGGGDPELDRMIQVLMNRSSAGMATLERISIATDNYLQNLEKAKRR